MAGNSSGVSGRVAISRAPSGSNPDIYDGEQWDDSFAWYPYLFLSRSKPETHLAALSRIDRRNLARRAPPELRALIDHVRDVLFPEPDED
ncbi:hypothetical protein [Paracoccus sp. (in: a-proteobacteria)]|uniref:hypothetical protein n=1 Tax=Paracoccus sp. TaxID=267 RepID=UPI0028A726B7|nr:hypothetical protein [Paracoccus sp. (in: a-proteobacteria)]